MAGGRDDASMGAIEFGTVISAVGEPGASDTIQYAEALADADHVARLGYDALWVIEHHFSDYFPTPSPMVMLAHLAGRLPDIDLGTCVVVLPWYSPLRLAEEIAMVNQLSRGTLHIGFGRGLARLEYDAFGIDMGESRARFRECHAVIGKALGGAPFTHGGRFFAIDRPIELRPKPVLERVRLYGATNSPETALIMAEIGLPMLRVSNFPLPYHSTDFESWNEATRKRGRSTDVARPILIHAVLADTDAEALALAKSHLSRYFEKMVEHYEADADPWKEFEDYKAFSKFMATAKKLTDPENMVPFTACRAPIGTRCGSASRVTSPPGSPTATLTGRRAAVRGRAFAPIEPDDTAPCAALRHGPRACPAVRRARPPAGRRRFAACRHGARAPSRRRSRPGRRKGWGRRARGSGERRGASSRSGRAARRRQAR